jgi:NAD(P)-dependent dehydrogenase (short-subunit alcohol dehydrogenase family)
VVQLDVTDQGAVAAVVADAIARHGAIDVLVNNAGRGQVGAVEETTDAELRDLMDVHFYGPAALVRAVLPHMRERRSGAIVQMSSSGGQLSVAGFGAYSATKCALEGLSEALAEEVRPQGIRVMIVEPGAFRTSFFGGALHRSASLPAYEETVAPTRDMISGSHGRQPGDPRKAARAIIDALTPTSHRSGSAQRLDRRSHRPSRLGRDRACGLGARRAGDGLRRIAQGARAPSSLLPVEGGEVFVVSPRRSPAAG